MKIKVFATKYALSLGIEEFIAEWNEDFPTRVSNRWHSATYHGEGRDWHRNYSDAVAKAEKMRVAKIVDLKKQIAKLEKMTWNK
jgi:hypothetical protein